MDRNDHVGLEHFLSTQRAPDIADVVDRLPEGRRDQIFSMLTPHLKAAVVAGDFYIYAERAFGRFGGFVVGWSDWLNQALGLSFISVGFGEYAAQLFSPNLRGGRIIISISILVVVASVNLIGARSGSEPQKK